MIGQIYKLPSHLPLSEKIRLADENFRALFQTAPDWILIPADSDIDGLFTSIPWRPSRRVINDCLWAVKEHSIGIDTNPLSTEAQ